METMRQALSDSGHDVNVVAINIVRGEPYQENLVSRCSFDLLQDVSSVGAWQRMGGGKDDMFIYREGGTLAPGGYLPISGPINTVLSTPDGYANVYEAIVKAAESGPGEVCPEPDEGGWQRPGDANQDGHLDMADGVAVLLHLFVGGPQLLPCGEGKSTDAGNQALVDVNLDGVVDSSDVIHLLRYLFLGDAPPRNGTECIRIPTCPEVCEG